MFYEELDLIKSPLKKGSTIVRINLASTATFLLIMTIKCSSSDSPGITYNPKI